MKRDWIIFTCGLVVFFLPLLGFPRVFNSALYIIIGILLVVLALRNIRKEYVKGMYIGQNAPENNPTQDSNRQ